LDGREVAESGEEGDDSWSESSVQSDFGLEFGDSDLTFGSLLVDVLLLPSEERGRRGVSFKGRERRKEMVELARFPQPRPAQRDLPNHTLLVDIGMLLDIRVVRELDTCRKRRAVSEV